MMSSADTGGEQSSASGSSSNAQEQSSRQLHQQTPTTPITTTTPLSAHSTTNAATAATAEKEDLMVPLMSSTGASTAAASTSTTTTTTTSSTVQVDSILRRSLSNNSNKTGQSLLQHRQAKRSRAGTGQRNGRNPTHSQHYNSKRNAKGGSTTASGGIATTTAAGTTTSSCGYSCCGSCCRSKSLTRFMSMLANVLVWASVVSLAAAVVWYSYELTKHGTDPHLIAWFSAGAFVLLGFPISMYGIVSHLANYNQPHIQCYVVRILWMVPIYSMESWLCLRFHKYAIYIETLRDCYESYVLYCFFEFLIQVLGGQEELISILKLKSPTRGVHMWGLQWCVRPWLMGQPVSRVMPPAAVSSSSAKASSLQGVVPLSTSSSASLQAGGGGALSKSNATTTSSTTTTMSLQQPQQLHHHHARSNKAVVQWTSPFFVKCKFGVLQYVLLKFTSSIFVMVLELQGWYKEGDFTYKGGYLYICILTNLSQCWALYCLIFFYYATKNELGPIRPVGKFLSVKALVFFTWWQSVGISLLYQMDMIPHYHAKEEWTSEDVAKGLQDYLICIEMFLAAIVHVFVFPHTDYLVSSSTRGSGGANSRRRHMQQQKRLGRKALYGRGAAAAWRTAGASDDGSSKNSGYCDYDLEMASHASSTNNADNPASAMSLTTSSALSLSPRPDATRIPQQSLLLPIASSGSELQSSTFEGGITDNVDEDNGSRDGNNDDGENDYDDDEDVDDYADSPVQVRPTRPGFVSALLDSAIPRDVVDNTAGIVKGAYHVEKRTLLYHATTADQYDLFGNKSRLYGNKRQAPQPAVSTSRRPASSEQDAKPSPTSPPPPLPPP